MDSISRLCGVMELKKKRTLFLIMVCGLVLLIGVQVIRRSHYGRYEKSEMRLQSLLIKAGVMNNKGKKKITNNILWLLYKSLVDSGYDFFSTSYEPAQIGTHRCSDSMCSEYLDEMDSFKYKICFTKSQIIMSSEYKGFTNGPCHFLDGRMRAPVGLISFPGSGNTWLRATLEAATGICTGSLYCDAIIRGHGFNGEKVTSGSVLVVKSHSSERIRWTDVNMPVIKMTQDPLESFFGKRTLPTYGMVILLIRNPYEAIVSEWNRRQNKRQSTNKHIGSKTEDHFGDYEPWDKFVNKTANGWKSLFEVLLSAKENNRPIYVVRYEDMKNDLVRETAKILDFLNMSVPNVELEKRLSGDLLGFKRKHHDDDFEHFTTTQKKKVNSAIVSTVTLLRQNVIQTYSIEEYLDIT